MLITGFPAGVFAANCYLAAPAPGEECVIIDPGQDAMPRIEELLAEYRLKPIAVLLTHGHVDHVFSVVPVCGARSIPAYIHPGDRERLADPVGPWAGPAAMLFEGISFTEPDDVRELADGEAITLAGLEFMITHTPGHTQGSVTYRTPAPAPGIESPAPGIESDISEISDSAVEPDPRGESVLFTGDLLFAGSIGRTDLPGGDQQQMLESLSRTLTLPDETVVLPGHGRRTSIGDERRANPFLTGLRKPAKKGL